jgi:hypothetical protein
VRRTRTKIVDKDRIREVLTSACIARGELTVDSEVMTHLFGSGSWLVR